MTGIIIKKHNGKYYFNELMYKDLCGKEKVFVDEMIREVKIDFPDNVRVKKPDLKRFNYKFPQHG